jgi:hypothetical protein
MVYKTRKTNKRKHLKKPSRKYSKRVYFGGEKFSNNNGFEAAKSADDIAGEKIMKEIQEQNEISIEDIPIVGPVLEKTGDLVEGASVKGIDIVADSIGIDLDNPGSIGDKLDDVNEAFSDPENVEKMKEIAGNAGQIAEIAVEASKPAINKFVTESGPIINKGISDAIKSGASTGVNLLNDVGGPIIGVPRTVWAAATAFNASVNAGSEIVKGASEAIQGTMENFDRIQNKYQVPNGEVPKVEVPKVEVPKVEVPKVEVPKVEVPKVEDAKSLRKFQNEANRIGGRIYKSQKEFLTPKINKTKMLKQYGGKKWKTKRRKYRY